jgi:tripartite-type tricarboxylate transporter receptor subunit TctC
MLISPHVYPKLGYDTLRDFVAVGSVARSMMCFAVGPAVPAAVTGIATYVAWVKANPKQALFGAPTGSSQHFCGQLLGQAVGVPLQHVPYKGGAPAMQDLIGGHLPANVSPVAEALPHHQAGKIRILAVAGARRSRFLPEVPALAELGYREVVFQDWLGVFAPAGTSLAIAGRLYAAMAETVSTPEGIAALGKFGMEADAAGPEAFPGIVKADWERYRGIVQATGFKAED